MTFLDYLDLLRQRIVVVLGVIGLTATSAAGLTVLQGPSYAGLVRLEVRPAAPGSAAAVPLSQFQEQSDLVTVTELVKSTDVARRVVAKLHLRVAPEDLLNSITATPVGGAVISIESRSKDPVTAVNLANAFADAYLESRRQSATASLNDATSQQTTKLQITQGRLDRLDGALALLKPDSPDYPIVKAQRDNALADLVATRTQLDALADRAGLANGFGQVIQPATRPRVVRKVSLSRSVVFGVIVGVPLALAMALLLDSLKQTVSREEDAERATGAPVMGVVPRDAAWVNTREARLATEIDPFSTVAEAYRTLAQNLYSAAAEARARILLVTSPSFGDGKSATVASLAVAFADAGRSVIAVEADFRRPRTHEFLHAAEEPGVAEVLDGTVPVRSAIQWLRLRLGFLPAGRTADRPDRILGQASMREFFEGLRDSGRAAGGLRAPAGAGRRPVATTGDRAAGGDQHTILVDTPPVLSAAETSNLAAVADGVVLVLATNLTRRQDAAAAAEQIRKANGSLLGVVLVGALPRRGGSRRDSFDAGPEAAASSGGGRSIHAVV